MVIKFNAYTVTGWIEDRSTNHKDQSIFTLHIRVLKDKKIMREYHSPVYEGYATISDAELELANKAHKELYNALMCERLPL